MTLLAVPINYLAVLIAAVVAFIIGALWYSPLMFSEPWARLSNLKIDKTKKQGLPLLMLINFIATLITSCVLAHIIKYTGAATLGDAFIIGFFIWLGFFAVATLLGSVIWESKPLTLYAINAGYWLTNLLAMSIILTLWQ